MKYFIILILLVVSCQSQTDQDRDKMQTLIDLKHQLENEQQNINKLIEVNSNKIYNEVDSIMAAMSSTISNRDSIAMLGGKITRDKMDTYLIPLQRVKDSITLLDSQIEDLKLLMGK